MKTAIKECVSMADTRYTRKVLTDSKTAFKEVVLNGTVIFVAHDLDNFIYHLTSCEGFMEVSQ